MASYEISDAEAEQLRNHPKVIGVEHDRIYYQGTYHDRNTFVDSQGLKNRYGSNVRIGRTISNHYFFNSPPTSADLSRGSAALYRHQQIENPWGNDLWEVIDDNIQYRGDGTDVDVIVYDHDAWYGHIEFVKTGVGEPTDFVGGNVLKDGFSTHSETGVCGVLDLVLDSPYYIDPDFFDANGGPTNNSSRLEIRWDGTVVPKVQDAIDWWNDDTKRSAKYCPVGSTTVDGDAGTAVANSAEDFGQISVTSTNNNRTYNGGTNTAQHTGTGHHGTRCMSMAYGKTHGWAFNSNKWHLPFTQQHGIYYEILKVFHQNKPNRSLDNTKNPTVASNSWYNSWNFDDNWYSYFRTPGTGLAGDGTINQISVSGSTISPEWLNYLTKNKTVYVQHPTSDSRHILGSDAIDAGVIFCHSAGNNNQKLVLDGHPDYDNYVSSSTGTTLAQAKQSPNSHESFLTNRVAYPGSIGKVENYNGSGLDKYRCFTIGAIHGSYNDNTNPTYEWKLSASNMGNAVDTWAMADQLCATDDNVASTLYDRYDSNYRLDTSSLPYTIVTSGGTLSIASHDSSFSGTSCATPVAAGIFATKLQHQRSWTWQNLKTWLVENVTEQPSDRMTQGTEATTANDSNWNSTSNLQGGNRRILWDAEASSQIGYTARIRGSLKISGSGLSITKSS